MRLRASLAAALAAAALALAAVAQAPVVATILNNGPTANRYDLVILGDGYTQAQQARFDQDCLLFLTALFQKQPYATFASYYNVHSVFRASAESGADHPDANPPVFRNTAYDAAYNTGGTARCLYIGNTTQALADAALAPANEGRVLVFVNDSRYGGCAGQFAVSYNGSSMTEVQIHEIGHSLAALADEYDYANSTYSGPEPSESNVTTSPVGQKWSHWWGTDGISSFQGARYCQFGIWRPKTDCLMRTLGIPLCAVCREQISRSVSSVVDVIENPLPATTNVALGVATLQAFSFTSLVPPGNAAVIEWRVDGVVQANQNGTSFVLDTAVTGVGQHTVEVAVTDQTTFVRHDPQHTLRDSRTWRVTVTDPTAADLTVTSLAASPSFALPGAEIDVTTCVHNAGPAAAANVTVDLFLSADTTWSTTDVWLGQQVEPSIGASASAWHTRRVRMPWLLEARLYFLFAVVDRENHVHEGNENDNSRLVGLFGQAGPCAVALEYRDDLVYPRDAATLPASSGGSVSPTVVARCAPPGTQYLVLWGCSGTQPGTTIAPGVHVPLNHDACTDVGLQLLNGTVFQAFFGRLDAQGIGRATFALPPGLSAAPQASHFAAVLIDSSPAFTAATGAISLTLR